MIFVCDERYCWGCQDYQFGDISGNDHFSSQIDRWLAAEWDFSDDEIRHADVYSDVYRFAYVEPQWTCDECGDIDELGRYYWNPDTGDFDAPRPLTPREQAERDRQQQEAAGQLRLL